MTSDQPTAPTPRAEPVLLLHASGTRAADGAWLDAVRGLGCDTLGLIAAPGTTRLDACLDDPRTLGPALAAAAPGRPVALLRAGVTLEPEALAALAAAVEAPGGPATLVALGNGDARLNPLAGLDLPEGWNGGDCAALVRLLAGPGTLPGPWSDHAVMLSSRAVARLAADGDGQTDLATALRRGGEIRVAPWAFAADARAPLAADEALEAHERERPPAWGDLAARLATWIAAGAHPAPLAGAGAGPATLHVTHAWGGGVAAWVRAFIEADRAGPHYQLVAEGPRSGAGAGQRIALYAGTELAAPVADWWLSEPIESTVTTHPEYAAILRAVLGRCGVGRVMVSSVIGHALDVLGTGLPTVRVLHDHYPLWPLLGVHPGPYLADGAGVDLARALAEHAGRFEFRQRDPAHWRRLADAAHAAAASGRVRVAAPGGNVAALHRRLDPRWEDVPIEVIPHGAAPLPRARPVAPRPRADGRLRIVVPGRILPGKGQALLREALPRLAPHAQVTLLGAGKAGEAFFGLPGVDVVVGYERDTLADLVEEIGPDFAALLSVVPETFSYTLSEMWSLGLPVLATRVGSLAERIEHGVNGLLVDPTPDALVAAVEALARDRAPLAALKPGERPGAALSVGEMVDRYRRLWPLAGASARAPDAAEPLPPALLATQAGAARLEAARREERIRTLQRRDAEQQRELERRADWALEIDRQLREEQRRRRAWVARLEAELSDAYRQRDDARRHVGEMQDNLAHLSSEYEALAETHRMVLGSLSWRITRPLRVARRLGGRLAAAGAWNPLRWPRLLNTFARNWITFGFVGTLRRLQQPAGQAAPREANVAAEAPPVGDPAPPAQVPNPAEPAISIVIPVFEKWTYTAACLRSLVAAQGRRDFEVIVVDDQSSDETPERLAGIDGLVTVRNEKNLGFIGSCNAGAARARGRHLVLLNNDTQVLDGWLDALVDTLEEHPDIGLVGARLVYPNGALQECGGIVFRDGSGWNYGRGADAADPRYACLRDVDYCSGAAIALRRATWDALGGFDARYAPAYYEDTDLAFRVREAGLRTVVQPASTVIHHEGVTSGTDLASGVKRYQAVNRETFRQRWREVLARHPEPIRDPEDQGAVRRARDHALRGRVLVVDATTPQPDQDSGSVRLTNLMQCLLDLGWGVSFFADNRARDGRYTRALQARGVECWYDPWIDGLAGFFARHGGDFDAVVVSRHYVATRYVDLVRRHCPGARFVFDTVDLHYLREQRMAELEDSLPLRRIAERTRRFELEVVRAADATLVVSPVEVEVLAEDAPGAKVHVLSNIHEVEGRRAGFAERRDLFFVGGFQHPPNVDAVCWFVTQVWPRVRERLPEASFHVIGSKAPAKVQALQGEGVVVHGFVADLDPYLDGCRLAVAPLRYGAGVKGKVNLSMSRGQPVVATPIAVEGMYAEHGLDVLVAETPEAFADEVVRLYSDEALWGRLSEAAITNVETHFSMDAAAASLETLFAELGVGASRTDADA